MPGRPPPAARPPKVSMAARARDQMIGELLLFWREQMKEGRKPWAERPIVNFYKFSVWIRCQIEGNEPLGREAESNMVLSRLLVRFGEYLECRDQVLLGLETERALGLERRVAPRPTTLDAPAGHEELLRELARAVDAMKTREPNANVKR